jgi:hypothetical protein
MNSNSSQIFLWWPQVCAIAEGTTSLSEVTEEDFFLMSLHDQDPELACLVADMSVTQMPAPRRDDGGSRGRTHRVQGTSVGSTVTGTPFTIWSGENGRNGDRGIPREVDMSDEQGTEANMAGSNTKRLRIFVVPTWNTGFSAYCFQFIGQGASY